MLQTERPEQIVAYLQEKNLLQQLELTAPISVTFLAQGEYNENFTITDAKGKKLVFRLNHGSQLELKNQIEYEFGALKVLEKSQRTPHVYHVDNTRDYFPFGLLIMEFLPGVPLNYQKDLPEAARIFADIHLLTPSKAEQAQFISEEAPMQARIDESERLLKPFFEADCVEKKTKQIFDRYLDWCHKNVSQDDYFKKQGWWVINNTEVNSHNFIITEEKGWLIDWEKPVISHPCQDLTQFLADTTTLWRENVLLSNESKENFIKIYSQQVGHNFNEIQESIQIYSPYLYLRALSWSAMAYATYQQKELQNQEILEKVTSYMDESFLHKILAPYGVLS